MSTQMLGALRKSIRSQTINHQLLSHFISTGSFQLIFPNFNPSCHLISCNIHKPSVSCKRWKLDSITLTPPPSMARESRQLHIDRIFESVGVIILHGSHQQTYQLLEKLHQIWFKLPRIRSEEVLGKALRRVPRHTYYIGTKVDIVLMIDMIINVVITICCPILFVWKVGRYGATWETAFDFSEERILAEFDLSLKRLQLP